MTEQEAAKEVTRMALVGYCFSKAILDDYCDVISSVTGVDKKEVRARIVTKAMKEQTKLKEKLDHSILQSENFEKL